MIKDYIQLGQYAFIEVPDKQKADKFITDIGIASHKWNNNDIQYGFSRYDTQNCFCINFYVTVGLHYHIYNVFVQAVEAECLGVKQVGGTFWEEYIPPEKYSDTNLLKPKTDYVVVKILLNYPLNLFHPNISSADPDTLQFCIVISDTSFWYCEFDLSNFCGVTEGRDLELFRKYKGYPGKLIADAKNDSEVLEFIENKSLWISTTIDSDDIDKETEEDLLNTYGIPIEDFEEGAERNQIIAEMYFEVYVDDFRK
ncbi:MAG: hypothetical protein LBT43_19155 [Prevotella sp.]|jgi:hypothetical protein|nr:hypothetical protein [Prevotella sp.]